VPFWEWHGRPGNYPKTSGPGSRLTEASAILGPETPRGPLQTCSRIVSWTWISLALSALLRRILHPGPTCPDMPSGGPNGWDTGCIVGAGRNLPRTPKLHGPHGRKSFVCRRNSRNFSKAPRRGPANSNPARCSQTSPTSRRPGVRPPGPHARKLFCRGFTSPGSQNARFIESGKAPALERREGIG